MSDRGCSVCKKEIYSSGDLEMFTYCGDIYWLCDECSYKIVTLIENIQNNAKGQ